MKTLWTTFLDICEEAHKSDAAAFVGRYNAGGLARTRLMLGTGGAGPAGRATGLMYCAIDRRFNPSAQRWETSFERYHDLVMWSGDFRYGQQLTELACEVENGSDLKLGELSFLLRSQSTRKIALRYPVAFDKREVEQFVHRAFSAFHQRGYRESDDTEYLLMFGPSTLQVFDRTQWRCVYFTSINAHHGGPYQWL